MRVYNTCIVRFGKVLVGIGWFPNDPHLYVRSEPGFVSVAIGPVLVKIGTIVSKEG